MMMTVQELLDRCVRSMLRPIPTDTPLSDFCTRFLKLPFSAESCKNICFNSSSSLFSLLSTAAMTASADFDAAGGFLAGAGVFFPFLGPAFGVGENLGKPAKYEYTLLGIKNVPQISAGREQSWRLG